MKTGSIAKGGVGGLFSVVSSIFNKIGLRWGITAIIILVLFSSSIIQSTEQGSAAPFLDNFMSRIFLSDNNLGESTKEIIENPAEAIFKGDLRPVEDVGFLTKMINTLYNLKVEAKYFWARLGVFTNILTNIWFLYMMTWVLFKISMYLIIQDDSKKTAAVVMAVIFMVMFQMIFSAATYDKPSSWEDMSLIDKSEKIKPFRGTIYTFSHLPDLINALDNKINDDMKPLDLQGAICANNKQDGEVL